MRHIFFVVGCIFCFCSIFHIVIDTVTNSDDNEDIQIDNIQPAYKN